MQLVTLILSFVLYIFDMASDLYVAFQHLNNGDTLLFWLTAGIIILSLFVVNIAATIALESNVARTCGCFLHLSMIFLFFREIHRWYEENISERATCCPNKIHFSKCNCERCQETLKKSVKVSLKMSYVRSIETFCEAVPQWILQVIVMTYRQTFPWYTIVSVVISFISLVFSVYSLEKSFWIREIVNSEQSDPPRHYIRPVSFPTRSAVAFIVWQTLLLLGRLSAMVYFTGFIYLMGFALHWAILILSAACYLTNESTDTDSDTCCSRFCCHVIKFVILFPFFFPLLFHVSHSSVACLKTFMGVARISNGFIRVLAILVPTSFFLVNCGDMLFFLLVFRYGADDLFVIPYFAFTSLYVLAFIFQAIYHSSYCHPLSVTKREWERQPGSADVVHGTINIPITP